MNLKDWIVSKLPADKSTWQWGIYEVFGALVVVVLLFAGLWVLASFGVF